MSARGIFKSKRMRQSVNSDAWGEFTCNLSNTSVPLSAPCYKFGPDFESTDFYAPVGGRRQSYCFMLRKDFFGVTYCDQSPFGTYIKRTKKIIHMQSVPVESGDTFCLLRSDMSTDSYCYSITINLKQLNATPPFTEQERIEQMLDDDSFDSKLSAFLLDGFEEQGNKESACSGLSFLGDSFIFKDEVDSFSKSETRSSGSFLSSSSHISSQAHSRSNQDDTSENYKANTEINLGDCQLAAVMMSDYEVQDTEKVGLCFLNDSKLPDAPLPSNTKSGCAESMTPSTASQNSGKKCIKKRDALEEALLCSLCLEILYNPISLQPCMHCYCSGCYSNWMEKSNRCPQCRSKVERIGRNFVVSNMIEAYLKEHPEKSRSKAELENLDKANKITSDMMKIPAPVHPWDLDEDEIDDDDEDEDWEDYNFSSDSDNFLYDAYESPDYLSDDGDNLTIGELFDVFSSALYFGNAARVRRCRQCPPPDTSSQNTTSNSTPSSDSAASAVSNSAVTTTSANRAQQYICSPQQSHIRCTCCDELMPDRRERVNFVLRMHDPYNQQCSVCLNAYCHLYWGCKKPGCKGCIKKIKDTEFGDECMTTIINENRYESSVLKTYLNLKGKNWKHLLQECLQRLDSGRYVLPQMARMDSNSVVCFSCATKCFRDLAYLYRRDIPLRELPPTRRNCWWGKNCRTQKINFFHARRFNHICEPTRMW